MTQSSKELALVSKCCNYNPKIPQTRDPIFYVQYFFLPIVFEKGITDDAGENGVQLFSCTGLEAYGGQAVAATNQLCCTNKRGTIGKIRPESLWLLSTTF